MRLTRHRQYPVEQRLVDEAGSSLHGGQTGTAPVLPDLVDADMHSVFDRLGGHDTRLAAHDTRLNALESRIAQQPIQGITAASGWAVSEAAYWRWGPIVSIAVSMSRTGATLTADSAGNIADTAIFTLPAAFHPPAQWFGSFTASLTGGTYVISTSGLVTMMTAHTNSQITNAHTLRVFTTYFTAM
ncbi:hypothetical protein [Glycomyces sp. YM15]|uniref:hypothetical protein n=1 Tax=Glycomyces sp. YM15 TaxID=2800446 RepID=UPI0019642A88|nr:hypothetical protein [Glycomyces sp. YM15]